MSKNEFFNIAMSFSDVATIDALIKQAAETEFFIHLARLDIDPSKNLEENLETIYEWEYKYHKILQSQKTNPYRKEKLLNTIEQQMRPVVDRIIEDLSDVFRDWLSKHAILNPREWAEARVDMDEFEAYDPETTLGTVKYEYETLGGKNFEINFFKENKEYFKRFFEEVRSDIINMYYDDLEYYIEHEDTEEIERMQQVIDDLENMDLDNEEDFNRFINEYYPIDEYMDEGSLSDQISNHPKLYSMLVNFLADKVFPLWFAKWEDQGIEQTRESIEEIYNELEQAKNSSFRKVLSVINKALNAAHQTGPMMDYISDRYEISSDLLNNLSNLGKNEIDAWNRDLTEIGVWQ